MHTNSFEVKLRIIFFFSYRLLYYTRIRRATSWCGVAVAYCSKLISTGTVCCAIIVSHHHRRFPSSLSPPPPPLPPPAAPLGNWCFKLHAPQPSRDAKKFKVPLPTHTPPPTPTPHPLTNPRAREELHQASSAGSLHLVQIPPLGRTKTCTGPRRTAQTEPLRS